MGNHRKVAVVGLDAVIPTFAERFMAEGKLPNLKRLRDGGFWTELIPTVPAWTPTGWATVATGANASTHGIEGFFIHVPGEDYSTEHPGFDSQRCQAPFIWESALNYGKKSVIFKYPGTWPPRTEGIVQVGGGGGYGGLHNELDISHAVCYTTSSDIKNGWPVEVRPATGWSNLPTSVTNPLEAELPVVYNRPAAPKAYWLLVYTDVNGRAKAALTSGRDAKQPLATLREGEWSEFIIDRFPLEEGETTGAFRVKLIELQLDDRQLRLYMSQNLPATGYCRPLELDEALWEAVGPPTEYTAYKPLFWGWIDLQTQAEIFQQHTDWVSRTATFLLKNQEWDIFYTQFHPVDYAQHIYWAGFDPLHPDYQANKAQGYWNALGDVYALADTYLGAVMDAVSDDTVVVAVGDHGHQPYRWTFYVNNYLRQRGLLDVVWDEESSRWAIDWSKTKAYCYGPVHIALNLKGRDPHGIVDPGEYEALQQQIIDWLYEVRNDATGERPVKLAIPRQQADAFGLYGDGVGDVIMFTHPGYDTGNAERMGQGPGYDPGDTGRVGDSPLKSGVTGEGGLFRPTRLMHDMTSEHPSQMPSEKLTRTLLCMAGPGVRQGVTRRVPTSIVNVTATVCELLEMPCSAHNEGHPISDGLKG